MLIAAVVGLVMATSVLTPGSGLPTEPPKVEIAKTAPSQTGIQPSAYRGKLYVRAQESYRKCVAYHESRGNYWATGNNGVHLGTYQFTHQLAHGVVWMMAKELKKTFGVAAGKRTRDELFATVPTKWNRYYWDMAFYTVLNWEYTGSGLSHWAAQHRNCATERISWAGA